MSTEDPKPSRLAIISIILPVVILLVWCVYIVLFGVLTENTANTPDNEITGYAMLFFGVPLVGGVTVIFSLVGIVLGVMGIRKKDSRKNVAMAGLVVNLLCLFPYLFLLVILLISATSRS